MNDDMVSPERQGPGGHSSKSAYMLFYVKDAKSQLEGIVNGAAVGAGASASSSSSEAKAGVQRERERDTNMSPPLVHKKSKQDLASQVSSRSPSAGGPSVSRFSMANGPKVNGSANGAQEDADADASLPPRKKLASSSTSSLLTQAVSPASFHGLAAASSSRALAQDEEEDVGETTTTGAIAGEGAQESDSEGADADADESLRSASESQPRTPAPAPLSKKQRRKLERRQKALLQQQRSSSSSSLNSSPARSATTSTPSKLSGVIASPYAQSKPIFRNFSPASGSGSAAGAGVGGEKKHLLKRLMSNTANGTGTGMDSPTSSPSSGTGSGKRQRSNEDDYGEEEGGARTVRASPASASAGESAFPTSTCFGSASGRKGWMSGMKKKKRER